MWLLIGDLHLTDHSRDDYRFKIFDWIQRQQEKRPIAATFIAGDITDSKDRHSATLVNKIVNGLLKIAPPVYIVMGNHDYRDPKNPFFKFLNHIDGLKFITKPTVIKAVRRMAIIPHYRGQDEFAEAVSLCGASSPDSFLVHQTFDGATAETGARLSGLQALPIELLKPPLGIYAGDVHKPQTQGMVTYIGCPYQVRFGDNFNPRSIWMDKSGETKQLVFDAPRKWSLTVRGPENILQHGGLVEGDQLKLTIEVTREEAVDWKSIKQEVLAACRELKLDIYGVKLEIKTAQRHTRLQIKERSPGYSQTLEQFCKAENVATHIRKTGLGMLGETNGTS